MWSVEASGAVQGEREGAHLGQGCLVRTGGALWLPTVRRDVQSQVQERAQGPECAVGLAGSEQLELKSLPLRTSRPVPGM